MELESLRFVKTINITLLVLLLSVAGMTNVEAQSHYNYVDLGLPSGTLWATCNVGANAPEEYGDYFAWGETQTKTTYNWITYLYCNGSSNTLTKYCYNSEYGYNSYTDSLTTLLSCDDAATANWGDDWRMPTNEEWEELFQNTTYISTIQNGINGFLFTASNGNNLFLPSAGRRWDRELNYAGSNGYYWSNSLYFGYPYDAWSISFDSYGYGGVYCDYRYFGRTIRPVFNNKAPLGVINSLFSVDENTQVYFSQGNLQYQATTDTWRFADNQWDYVGEGNANTSAIYDGWIDLFGWGTSGYHDLNDSNNVNYMPWSNATDVVSTDYNMNGYGPSTNMTSPNLTESSANYDWGINNAIFNGGYQTNQWRTLTTQEWNFLFNFRITPSGIRYAKANVNNVNGVILLPDNWNCTIYNLNNTNTSGVSYTSNVINCSQWTILEEAGVVFLPAAGYRAGSDNYVTNVGEQGFYWSSSYFDSYQAYLVYFWSVGEDYGVLEAEGHSGRYVGHSVRLVCPAQDVSSYSIEVIPNPTEGGTVTGAGTYNAGETCTLTATANSGYTFINWTKDGNQVSTEATYSFTVTESAIYEANFSRNAFHFTTAGTWSTASNWSNGALPGANDEVFIDAPCQLDQNATVTALTVSDGQSLTLQSGKTLTVTGNLSNTVATSLVIEDGAQLIHNVANVQATVKKLITPFNGTSDSWHLIALPLTGSSNVASVTNLLEGEYDLYGYDEATAYWRNQKHTESGFTELETTKGYLYANGEEVILGFSGTLENSSATITVPLSYTDGAHLSGFNLVGNPFPCNAYLNREYYILTTDGTDINPKPIPATTPIPPCTAVFVKAVAVGETVVFTRVVQ